MSLSILADVLQVVYGAALILLLIMAIGAWRSRQEVSTSQLSRDLMLCKQQCERRFQEHEARFERNSSVYARTDVIAAELKGIGQRLSNIERMLAHPPAPEEG